MANVRPAYSRGPKRHIEKVISQVHSEITNATTNVILHTSEDSKTLVRIRISGNILGKATGNYGWIVGIEPNGTAIEAPYAASQLDKDEGPLVILRGAGVSDADSDQMIDVDSKGMRKIKTGDEIVFRHLGDGASIADIGALVTLWFKE